MSGLVMSGLLVLAGWASAADEELAADPIGQALLQELERAMTLQMEDLPPPYFVHYAVDDGLNLTFEASYGQMVFESRERDRSLTVEVRVGSHEQDNSGFGYIPTRGQTPLPIDDDVLAMRHTIWLATDAYYKRAVEVLTRKRAYLKDKTLEDRPSDFERAEPVTRVEPLEPWDFATDADMESYRDLCRRLSARFIEHEPIESSSVSLVVGGSHEYQVNSEGTRLRLASRGILLTMQARAQAEDGEALFDSRDFFGEAELPDFESLAAAADALAHGLLARRAAPRLDEYTGPVLFEGVAGAQLFRELLAPGIVSYIEPIGEERSTPMGAINLERRLGKSILPDGYQVFDDPGVKVWEGDKLFGSYSFDDEGVASRRVSVVEDGVLHDLLQSRTPTRKLEHSNGHGRHAMGEASVQTAVGVLFIEDDKAVADDTLIDALCEEAAAAGLEYGLVVRRLKAVGLTGNQDDLATFYRKLQQGGMALPDPLEVAQVFVADRREVPVRGLEFGAVSSRLLRDILATGKQPAVHNYIGLGLRGPLPPATLIAPSVLVEELELARVQEENDQPPLLRAPRWREAR